MVSLVTQEAIIKQPNRSMVEILNKLNCQNKTITPSPNLKHISKVQSIKGECITQPTWRDYRNVATLHILYNNLAGGDHYDLVGFLVRFFFPFKRLF